MAVGFWHGSARRPSRAAAAELEAEQTAGDEIVSSHSTSYHARFVTTPRTYILEKKAGATLLIDLERRNDRVVVVDAR